MIGQLHNVATLWPDALFPTWRHMSPSSVRLVVEFVPAIAFAMLLFIGLRIWRLMIVARARLTHPRCVRCHFTLRGEGEGLPAQCPECGEPISERGVVWWSGPHDGRGVRSWLVRGAIVCGWTLTAGSVALGVNLVLAADVMRWNDDRDERWLAAKAQELDRKASRSEAEELARELIAALRPGSLFGRSPGPSDLLRDTVERVLSGERIDRGVENDCRRLLRDAAPAMRADAALRRIHRPSIFVSRVVSPLEPIRVHLISHRTLEENEVDIEERLIVASMVASDGSSAGVLHRFRSRRGLVELTPDPPLQPGPYRLRLECSPIFVPNMSNGPFDAWSAELPIEVVPSTAERSLVASDASESPFDGATVRAFTVTEFGATSVYVHLDFEHRLDMPRLVGEWFLIVEGSEGVERPAARFGIATDVLLGEPSADEFGLGAGDRVTLAAVVPEADVAEGAKVTVRFAPRRTEACADWIRTWGVSSSVSVRTIPIAARRDGAVTALAPWLFEADHSSEVAAAWQRSVIQATPPAVRSLLGIDE